jgi:hypothetical protein
MILFILAVYCLAVVHSATEAPAIAEESTFSSKLFIPAGLYRRILRKRDDLGSTDDIESQIHQVEVLAPGETVAVAVVNEEEMPISREILITWLIFLVLSFSASAWGLIYTFNLLGKGYQTSTLFSAVVCFIGFSVLYLVLLSGCCDGRDFVELLWVLCKRNKRRADHVEMVDWAEIEEEIDGGEVEMVDWAEIEEEIHGGEVEMVDDDADRDFRNEEGV